MVIIVDKNELGGWRLLIFLPWLSSDIIVVGSEGERAKDDAWSKSKNTREHWRQAAAGAEKVIVRARAEGT